MLRALAGLILACLSASAVERAFGEESPPRPEIALSTGTEEGKKTLIATVKRGGKPLEGATVAFLVRRTFGWLSLGQDVTLDDGTAAVPFPIDLPGGPTGELQVRAEIRAPEPVASVGTELTLGGGHAVPIDASPLPRALWAPQSPLPLILVVGVLLGTVWGTYLFVAWQLIRIRREGRS
jgi:hypothetical protein